MAKSKQDIVKVEPKSPLVSVPKFMTDDQQMGTEEVAHFVIIPRIKVVQKQASTELLSRFHPGDIIVSPVNALVAQTSMKDGVMGEFAFVPLYFFPEYCVWNPIQLKGTEPAIIERTTDVNSPIAVKALNAGLREEPHPVHKQYKVRYVEHLNYVVQIIDHAEMTGEVAVLSFARGENFAGRKFAGLIKMRRAPLFGCKFVATVAHRPGTGKGDWYGLDVDNHVNPWVEDENEYARLRALHKEFRQLHEANRLRPDLSDEELTEDVSRDDM